jgi:hypothetical protein
MTPLVPPCAVPSGGGTGAGRLTPGGSGAVGCGAPSAAGPVPPMGPLFPTAPNGEWIGQKAVGSVPVMNDSM